MIEKVKATADPFAHLPRPSLFAVHETKPETKPSRQVPSLYELEDRITAVEDRQHREWDR